MGPWEMELGLPELQSSHLKDGSRLPGDKVSTLQPVDKRSPGDHSPLKASWAGSP